MKTILPITFAAVCALFTACDTRVNTDGKPDTTIVNPPANKETNTTVVTPPATEKKTETNTTVTPSGASQTATTETKK